MAELIWGPSALKDINNIALYVEKDSLQAAQNLVQLFFEKAEILVHYPQYGKPVPEVGDSSFREILVSRYRIIYELTGNEQVRILTVHHQSRLLKNNPNFKKGGR